MDKDKYEKTAGDYYSLDSFSQPLKNYAEKEMIHSLPESEFLLEVGCGNGHSLGKYNSKKVLGLEFSDSMISQANNKLKNRIIKGDITKGGFVKKYPMKFDVVVSNYVMMELSSVQLDKAFFNINKLLTKNGTFCFTITDPRTRQFVEFPGYKNLFSEKFNYRKKDLVFKVLLKDDKGNFVDVGIKDFHNPLSFYDCCLKENGFCFKRVDLLIPYTDVSFAVLYKCKKISEVQNERDN